MSMHPVFDNSSYKLFRDISDCHAKPNAFSLENARVMTTVGKTLALLGALSLGASFKITRVVISRLTLTSGLLLIAGGIYLLWKKYFKDPDYINAWFEDKQAKKVLLNQVYEEILSNTDLTNFFFCHDVRALNYGKLGEHWLARNPSSLDDSKLKEFKEIFLKYPNLKQYLFSNASFVNLWLPSFLTDHGPIDQVFQYIEDIKPVILVDVIKDIIIPAICARQANFSAAVQRASTFSKIQEEFNKSKSLEEVFRVISENPKLKTLLSEQDKRDIVNREVRRLSVAPAFVAQHGKTLFNYLDENNRKTFEYAKLI